MNSLIDDGGFGWDNAQLPGICESDFMAYRLSAILCVLTCGASAAGFAQDHSHAPVAIPEAPSISRLKVSFAEPRRVTVDASGNILVADSRAGVVFRTAPDGITSVLADGLDQPVAVTTDEEGNAYIATASNGKTGAGYIYKVTPAGDRQQLHAGLTSPTDLVRSDSGILTVSLGSKNQIIALNPDGERKVLCDQIESPSALCRGRDGELFVASGKGQVFQLLASGRIQKLADGLKSPTDFGITHDGQLIVADSKTNYLTAIEKGGKVSQFAKVPHGTVSVAFSPTGNMVVANSRLQSVTRVTSYISGPCPHCDKSIRYILKKPKAGRSAF